MWEPIRASEVERRLLKQQRHERIWTIIYAIGIVACVAIVAAIMLRFM